MLITTLTQGPDKVFVVGLNDEGATIVKGQLVMWDMNGTNDGIQIVDLTAVQSSLVVGTADADIANGDYGLVQVYGLDDDAIIYKHGSATNGDLAVGDVMVVASAIEGLSAAAPGADAFGVNTIAATNNVAATVAQPMFVAAETMASSSATATTTAKVFIRCM
jgi:hypothetical protein